MITTASRLRIACLGGIYEPQIFNAAEAAPGFMSPFFSHHSIDRLLSNTLTSSSSSQQSMTYSSLASIQASASSFQTIDIFLTNTWPPAITHFSQTFSQDPQMATAALGAPPLDDVIQKIKPRYHFSAGSGPQAQHPRFWEREPYIWDDEKGRISRFISLGPFGGEPPAGKKQRVHLYLSFCVFANTLFSGFMPSVFHQTMQPNLHLVRQMRPKTLSWGMELGFTNGHWIRMEVRISSSGMFSTPKRKTVFVRPSIGIWFRA